MEFDFKYCQNLIKESKFSVLENYAANQLKTNSENQIQKLEFLALSQFYLGKIKNAEINYLKILKKNPNSINAIIYFAREKYFDGFLSLLAIIPVVGSLLKLSIKGIYKPWIALKSNSGFVVFFSANQI